MQVEEVRIDEISNHERNPKIHNETQIRLLEKSIKKFGYTNPVILSADGVILAGHARVKAAIQMGQDTIPCIRTKLSGKDADAYLIADNRLTELAQYDRDILTDLLSDLPKDLIDFTGFDSVQVDALLAGEDIPDIDRFISDSQPEEPREEVDAEPQIDRAAELNEKWQVKPGDLWQCGVHRLICGDCTDPAVVERVMMGEKADLVFTDPPYGISVVDKSGVLKARYKQFENDNSPDIIKEFFKIIPLNSVKYLLWGGNYFAHFMPKSTCWIIWDKRGSEQMGGSSSGDQSDCEVAWTNFDSRAVKKYVHVWACWFRAGLKSEELPSKIHPTQKPVGLFKRILQDYSEKDDIIIDPFLGSGTTMIACENTGRKCRGIEISPEYCAVILQRYQDATGKEPVRING